MAAAMAAIPGYRTGVPILANALHGAASGKLKELNEAKRRARPAPDTSDTRAVEYLYARGDCSSDWPCLCEQLTGTDRFNYHLKKFQILKKTKQRIYYYRKPLPFDEPIDSEPCNIHDWTYYGTAFINRQKIEQEGEIWSHKGGGWWRQTAGSILKPPAPEAKSEPPRRDLSALKAAMAAAHPDRGGSSASFIEARARYIAARRDKAVR